MTRTAPLPAMPIPPADPDPIARVALPDARGPLTVLDYALGDFRNHLIGYLFHLRLQANRTTLVGIAATIPPAALNIAPAVDRAIGLLRSGGSGGPTPDLRSLTQTVNQLLALGERNENVATVWSALGSGIQSTSSVNI